jgi:Lrp/AsnC family leucine-responsive transcriptional regulator
MNSKKDYNTSYEPDKLDLEIINLLKEDSRTARHEIADKLNKTRQTIHNRISRLEENEIILRYTCLIDDKRLGKEINAIILVTLDRAASVWDFTAKNLWTRKKELDIIEMFHIAGEYDAIIKMKTESIKSLEDNLKVITSIKGVQRTHTMVCLSGYEEFSEII